MTLGIHQTCHPTCNHPPLPTKSSTQIHQNARQKHLSAVYKRMWDPDLGPDPGAPLGCRIIQDIERAVYKNYLQIFERCGRVLDTAEYTYRHTKEQHDRFVEQWGGRHV